MKKLFVLPTDAPKVYEVRWDEIVEHTVLGETPKTYVVADKWGDTYRETRMMKDGRAFFSTWELAHAYRLERAERAVESAKDKVRSAERTLDRLRLATKRS